MAEAQAEDMAAAVTAAREAFDRGPWPRLSHAERAEYLRAIAGALDERGVPLNCIWSQMGVLHTIARGGSAGFGGTYRYYAGLADDFPFVERHEPKAGGRAGFLVREPVGVVGARPRRRRPCWPVAPSFSRPPPKHLGRPTSWPRSPRPSDCPPGVFNVVTADRPVFGVARAGSAGRQDLLHRFNRSWMANGPIWVAASKGSPTCTCEKDSLKASTSSS